jgi:hypothetical protein
MKTTHPLILKAAKHCKDCGYEMKDVTSKVSTDPHTKERMETSRTTFVHKSKRLPTSMKSWLTENMRSISPANKSHYSNPTGQVSVKVHELPSGHELRVHSVRIIR